MSEGGKHWLDPLYTPEGLIGFGISVGTTGAFGMWYVLRFAGATELAATAWIAAAWLFFIAFLAYQANKTVNEYLAESTGESTEDTA